MELAVFWVMAFGLVGALVLVPIILRHRTRIETLRLVAETAGKGHTLDPALVTLLMAAPKSNMARLFAFICLFCGPAPLLLGILSALAVFGFGDLFGPGDSRAQWLQIAIFAGGAGLGYTIVGVAVLRLYGRERDA